jgi:hypothetical protein
MKKRFQTFRVFLYVRPGIASMLEEEESMQHREQEESNVCATRG